MSFPEPHIHPPTATHTHTIILLHGRGSSGPELAEELFESITSTTPQDSNSNSNSNLPAILPNVRWVFPTTRDRWDTRFQEEMPAWFDAYSLTDIEERQELQVEGLKESVSRVLGILEKEVESLNGDAGRVFLGGMSQGMAVAVWVVIYYLASATKEKALGGVLGFCGWFPFARKVEEFLSTAGAGGAHAQFRRLISSVLGGTVPVVGDQEGVSTPIPTCLLHGTDDAFVSVELGRQAATVLQKMGMPVMLRVE